MASGEIHESLTIERVKAGEAGPVWGLGSGVGPGGGLALGALADADYRAGMGERLATKIVASQVIIGLEVHIELSCQTKAFSGALSPARQGSLDPVGARDDDDFAAPNTLIDPVVLGLPGALPTVNHEAIAMSIAVGLALNCQIAPITRWDRKNYFYPDMPKGYQISQYDQPICGRGYLEVPRPLPKDKQRGGRVLIDPAEAPVRVGIVRAHLEEDAGKLLHEAPGHAGRGNTSRMEHSIVDLNRAGTSLLEVVTEPDFRSAEEVVIFCQQLRQICRYLGVTLGVMQKGHMRFEPNVNCHLTLADGQVIKTPIVEVKNLNSFKAVRGAIEYEARQQPERWLHDGRVMGPGSKQTRGWDDRAGITTVQREKEDAHDYRYFPEPDLLPVVIDQGFVSAVKAGMPRLPGERRDAMMRAYGLSLMEAEALTQEREDAELFEASVREAMGLGVMEAKAGRLAANVLLQSGMKRLGASVGEEDTSEPEGDGQQSHSAQATATSAPTRLIDLGITARGVAGIVQLRDQGEISAGKADELFGVLCEMGASAGDADARKIAQERGWLLVKDTGAMEAWVTQAIEQQPQAAADVKAGKDAAIGRIVGAAMKASGGQGDAAGLREIILRRLRG